MVTYSAIRLVVARCAVASIASIASMGAIGCLDQQAGVEPQVPNGQPMDAPSDGDQPGYAQPGQPGYTQPQPRYQPQPAYGQPLPAPVGPPPRAGFPAPSPMPPPAALPPAALPPTSLPPASLPPAPPPPPPPPAAPPPASTPHDVPGGFAIPFPFPGLGQRPIQSTGPATPIDPNIAGVGSLPLAAFAQREAPGMNREGVTMAANFREGQTLEQPFRMLPGRCYTVLALGAGVSQLEIAIVAVTPIPGTSGPIAQASGTNSAALGGHGNCIRWDLPIGVHAKYVVRAARGQGVAAAQLYSSTSR